MTKEVKNVEQGQINSIDVPDTKQLAKYLDVFGYKDIPQTEKEQFIEICKINGLNPFKREAHISAYGSGDSRQFAVITSYEVYLKRAESTGLLDGYSVETGPCQTIKMTQNGESKVIEDFQAIVTIHRKDFNKPFVFAAKMSENVKKTNSGYVTKFWYERGEFMLKKTALSQAFRICFSGVLGGMPYTKDEMPDYSSETIDVPAEVLEEQKKPEVKKPEAKTLSAKSFTKVVSKLDNLEVLPNEIISYIKSEKIKLTPDQKTKLTELKSLDSERYEQVVEKVKSGEWVAEQAAQFTLTEEQIVGINSLAADLPE